MKNIFAWVLLLLPISIYATNEDAVLNKANIIIGQKFEGQGHCPPSFDCSWVYYNQVDDDHVLIKIESATSINADNRIDDVYCEYNATTGKYKFTKKDGEEINKIIVASHVNNMENDGDVEFEFDILKPGSQMKTAGASDPCYNNWNDFRGGYRNSFSILTRVVCDAAIPVTVKNDKDHLTQLNLDKGEFQFDENESVQLELGGYYEKGQTRIRYKVNGNDNWYTIYTDKKITPNKEIKLWYHNIIGPFGTVEYKSNIGKFITIRVEKQLQDGTWSYGDEVECRFYSTGPSFDIVDVRRSSCDEQPLSIKIYTEEIDKFCLFFGEEIVNSGKMQWNLALAEKEADLEVCPAFTLKKCEDKGNNTFEIMAYQGGEDNEANDLSTYLKDNSNIHYCLLQLKVIEREGRSEKEKKDDESLQKLIPVNKPFELSPKLDTVKISIPLYEYTTPNDPSVYLGITDEYSRLTYRIYDSDKDGNILQDVKEQPLAEFYFSKDENGKELDMAALEKEFNDSYKNKNPNYSLNIQKGDYRKTYFQKWYNSAGATIRSTTIIKDPYYDKPTEPTWDIKTTNSREGYDIILRTTSDEKQSYEDKYTRYTYLCKFHVGTSGGRPDGWCCIKFKGELTLPDVNTGTSVTEDYKYELYYKTGTNAGLILRYLHNDPIPGSSYGYKQWNSEDIPVSLSCVGTIVQYHGKGNGYYLVEQLTGGQGEMKLIDMSTFEPINLIKSDGKYLNVEDFGYPGVPSVNYVLNDNMIAFQDYGWHKYVWHDGEFYYAYDDDHDRPIIYTFEEDEDGTGFTYWIGNTQYHTLYDGYSWEELYDYHYKQPSDRRIVGYDDSKFDDEWRSFMSKRQELWDKFRKSKIDDICYKVKLKNQKKGYLVLKDSDGCYSKPVQYDYNYNVFSCNKEIIKYPDPCTNNGEVKITNIKGSLGPYKYGNIELVDGTIIKNLGYGDNPITFFDKRDKPIPQNINIQPDIKQTIVPQTCSGQGGKYKIEKEYTNSTLPEHYKLKINGETKYNIDLGTEKTGIIPGNYKLYINCSSKDIYIDDVTIGDNSFKVEIAENSITDATEIGGNGSVTLNACKIENGSKWSVSENNTIIGNYTTNSAIVNLPYGNHTLYATHNGCTYNLNNVFIDGPGVVPIEEIDTNEEDEGPESTGDVKAAAIVSYNVNNNTATINMECGTSGNIKELTLYLLSKKDNNVSADNIVKDTKNNYVKSTTTLSGKQKLSSTFNYSTNSTYYIYAKYKAGNATTYSTICLTEKGISPITLDGCNAELSSSSKDRCYGKSATINLSGVGCKFKINGNFIDSESYITDESDVLVEISKKETSNVGAISIAQSVYREVSLHIDEIKMPQINMWGQDVTCFDASDGAIMVESAENIKTSVSELLLRLKNDDKPGATILNNLPASEYVVIIKDGVCEYERNADVRGPSSPLKISVIETVDPTCTNDNGTIKVAPEGGWGEYIFAIDEKPTIPDTFAEFCKDETYIASNSTNKTHLFGALSFGEHTAYVSDNKGCTQSVSEELYEYVNPKVTGALFDSVWCYGGENGTIKKIEFSTDDQVSDGDPMKMYYSTNPDKPSVESNWIDFSQTINNLKSADYYIWLKDKNQCVSDGFYNIHVDQPKPLKISISQQNNIIREYNHDGGSVTIEVEGGNKGQFNIFLNDTASECIGYAKWDGQETFTDIFAPDKTHKLFVVDYKKCTDSVETGYMRQPKGPLKVNGIPHPALCNKAQGSIKIAAEGGWGHYSYTYNLVNDTIIMQSQMDSVQVGGGQYVLTVIDSAGVMAYDTVTVPIPTDTLLANNLSRAAYCGSDGVISVDISGGTAPYTIETNFGVNPFKTMGGITTFTETKPKGTYVVYISDLNECKFTVPVTIVDSSVVVSIKRRYPSMRQYANGRLEAVATRGRAPYTYLWTHCNTGQTSTSAVWDNVPTGTYRLEVNDKAGCQPPVKIIYLATNDDLPLIINGKEGETGPDAQNGWASFSSDTSGFTQMILRRATGEEIDVIDKVDDQLNFKLTGLAPGDYVLECTLPKGEVRYAEFSIAKYIPMALFVTDIDHASQPGASDGSASLQITGGVAPYVVQMLHNDVFYDDTVLNGRQLVLPQLSAGTYAAIVIDKYGKRENTRFIIKEPDSPMQLTAESVQSPSCYGYSNGQIWLKAQGGWGDYEYALAGSDYSRTTMYGNRSAESYTFIAIDAKGVTDTLTVELSQPEPLRAGVAKVDSVSCFGLFDGGVTFDITGGTAPYYVEFDSLFTKPGNYIGSLNGGLHTFRFTDDKMCASDDDGLEVDVPQPEKLVIANDSVTPTTCNTDNGKIDIVIAGGIAPYTVKWKEDGLTVARLQGRTSIDSLQQLSLYSVVAVDANNCETEDRSYRMNRSSGPRINKVLTLPVLCYGDATGTAVIDSADITTAVPFAPFRIEWPNGQNAMSVNDLTAGAHLVTIIDTNNCVNSTRFEVGSPNPVEIKMIGSRDATCYGYTDGLISTLTLGGVGSYHYLWNTGDTLPDLDSIGKGSYTIVATDFNNCHDTATFSIGQPDSLHVEIGEESVLMCPGNTYEFIATSGFKTYCWVLNDSILSEKSSFIASDGGEYYLEATYGANCISRDTVTISIGDDLLEADFYMASDAAVDTALALVELSNMQIDSLHWEFSPTDFVVMDSADYELYLKPLKIGQHEITLWAYSGGCVSYITKQVEISELADTASNINLGYNPLIKSVDVMPNPTKGRFSIRVKLREDYNAEVSVSSAGQGKPVERRELSGKSEYEESFDLSNAGDGVYILRIVAGSEQRVAKVLLTK